MASTKTSLESPASLFFRSWPFHQLPIRLQEETATKLEHCTFQPGESICAPNELPSAIHYIVQGNARILGPASHRNPTLAVVGQGTILGWDSLLRRRATGEIRAAIAPEMDDGLVETLALPADTFETLALDHLLPILMQSTSPQEIFDTLQQALTHLPPQVPQVDLKDLVHSIWQQQLATIQHWDGSQSGLSSLALSADCLWLLSSGEFLNLPIGSALRRVQQLRQSRPSRFPVRLLGIHRQFLAGALLGRATSTPLPAVAPSTAPIFLPKATPAEIKTDQSAEPAAAVPPISPRPSASSETLPTSHYPVWKSRAPELVEDIVACYGMVCDRLQIPFRADSLSRLLKKQTLSKFEPVDLYQRVAQAIGLSASVVRFTPTAGGLNRLTTPSLIPCHDVFAVLYEVTPTQAIVASPRTGLLQLKPEDLAERLTLEDPTQENREAARCYAIALERLPSTPTKRFGFHWFLPVMLKQRSILIQVLLASIVIQLLGVANPLLVQQIIDQVIISANAGAMTTFGLLMILFAFLEGLLTILRTYLLISTTNRVDLYLGVEIVRHLLHLPLNFFEKRPVGELSSRLSELENIRQFLTDTAITTVMDVVFSVLYLGVMFLYSPTLTLCVLASVPVVIFSMLIMSRIQQKLIRVKADQGAKVQSYLVEILGGVASVKSQHMEALVEATWRDRYVQYLTSGFTTATVNTVFYSYSQFLNTVSSLLVLWVGAGQVLEGALSLGGLIAFRILAGYVTGPLLRLARLWQRFQETSLSMDLLSDIADAKTEQEPASQKAYMQMPPIIGRVEYHGVSFAFKPGQLQLSDIHLEVAPGTFVGVVGQSGSGKSTLMKLLPRLYTPQTGSICIDGYDISKVDLKALRSQIGIVSQDTVLFQGTIRDNIALFTNLSDAAVITAAKVAEAHDFIMQLPDGYETQVGERGSNLSGGQRQRIAIARVVARNPRLLIFDEATSALDYETERRVCANVMQHFRDRTCFFITHRLNTISRADWILFMQAGVIAEQGTHIELMNQRQLYYCLYSQQSREA